MKSRSVPSEIKTVRKHIGFRLSKYATDAFREAWDRIGLGNISSRVARVVMTNIYTFPVPELPTGGDYWPIRTGIGRRNALLRL